MNTKKWLLTKTYYYPLAGEPQLLDQADYPLFEELQPDEPPLTIGEVHGWIKDRHVSFAKRWFYRSEVVPVNKKRPKKGIVLFVTPLKGESKDPWGKRITQRVETVIYQAEDKIPETPNPQRTMF